MTRIALNQTTSNLLRLFGLLMLLGLGACQSVVGDTCTTTTQCGTGLVCDTTTKDGYCTKTPCRKGECPAEATCVEFPSLDFAGVTYSSEATFCMRTCTGTGTGDCRSGLTCRHDLIGKSHDLEGKAFCGVAPSSSL